MRTNPAAAAMRGLLWASVVGAFVVGSLVIASCQEKHEIAQSPETESSVALEQPVGNLAEGSEARHPGSAAWGDTASEGRASEAPEHEPNTDPKGGQGAAGLPCEYEVLAGDNLWSISEQFYGTHVYWKLLAEWNGVEEAAVIRVGQVVEVPPVSEFPHRLYLVQEGDNLTAISQSSYGSAGHWDLIAEANSLPDADRIGYGQIVSIPHPAVASDAPGDSTQLAGLEVKLED